MQAAGEAIYLPPALADYLIGWWLEIGPTSGGEAVSWQELAAWQQFRGPLAAWEAAAVRAMSQAFLAQQHDAANPDCPPPYSAASAAEIEQGVERKFLAFLNQLGAAPQPG